MDWVSRYIADEIAPEAVRPFWTEVAVHIAGIVPAILVCALIEKGLDSRIDTLPAVIFAAVLAPALVRTLARNPIRRAMGLNDDAASWWFKAGFIRFTPERARATLPTWQIEKAGLYLPGIGDRLGIWLSALVTLTVHASLWHDWNRLAQLTPYAALAAFIALVITLAQATHWMKLPEPDGVGSRDNK